jgi:hypothetical protein
LVINLVRPSPPLLPPLLLLVLLVLRDATPDASYVLEMCGY